MIYPLQSIMSNQNQGENHGSISTSRWSWTTWIRMD